MVANTLSERLFYPDILIILMSASESSKRGTVDVPETTEPMENDEESNEQNKKKVKSQADKESKDREAKPQH